MGRVSDPNTLTFINRQNLCMDECKRIFGAFGRLLSVREYESRRFIQYESAEDAEHAMSALKDEYRLDFAHKTNSIKQSNVGHEVEKVSSNFDAGNTRQSLKIVEHNSLESISDCAEAEGESELHKMFQQKSLLNKNDSTVGSISDKASTFSSYSIEDNPTEYSFASTAGSHALPKLVDVKTVERISGLVLGNIPDRYTVEDVYYLVEEANPVSISEVDVTRRKLRFCQVFVPHDKVDYLKKKLDGFLIGGKKLIACEISLLMSESKWLF